ncbi:MAG: AraC family transcriptional regulator [Acidobacteria bacterium]|nr:AraC family transcriptional regulator [Acidobacteriota bacterium]
MRYEQRRPAAPLDAFVESIWICENEPRPCRLERILPHGAAQLLVNLKEDETRSYHTANGSCLRSPGAIVAGMATRFQIIDTDEQEHVVGVSFRPGGTTAFFATPAHDLCDVDVPLDALWGAQGTALLREALLAAPRAEAKLDVMERALTVAWRERALHPAVAFALADFRARPSLTRIAAVTDRISLSPKRFIERFKAEVGVTPKRYCRLLRFQRAVTRAHAGTRLDWSQVALGCGYFDQAHLIHDFQAFAGLTPTAYQASRTAFQNHVIFLQSGGE